MVGKLHEIAALMPPPSAPDLAKDAEWRSAEEHFGSVLPPDYREFLACYGEGIIDEYLMILGPRFRNGVSGIVRSNRDVLSALASVVPGSRAGFPVALESKVGGVVLWGCTEDGDYCFWRCLGDDPQGWTTVVYSRHFDDWEEYPCGFSEFLLLLLSGSLDRPFYRSVFPESTSYVSATQNLARLLGE
ncbi:SMI1/KNR4 family protein [Yinghuangia soli]|uniref:SMI1/KNR4 family protein n=1 Tax=Yinghuangia soli TaxID=2908204 RepID=A0AA41PTT6_9ACTN|nr:SMI1/KNR4 family protein [Yinghuangia soli]MCF2525745.1 SMI1/KNR4 family protein [Yinghuangia soli]